LLAARPHASRSKQRPDIGAAFRASLANEQRLKIGEPHIIGPELRVDLLVGENLDRAGHPLPSRRKMPLITDRTRECDLTAIDGICLLRCADAKTSIGKEIF
jgi:hypothetical protein